MTKKEWKMKFEKVFGFKPTDEFCDKMWQMMEDIADTYTTTPEIVAASLTRGVFKKT